MELRVESSVLIAIAVCMMFYAIMRCVIQQAASGKLPRVALVLKALGWELGLQATGKKPRQRHRPKQKPVAPQVPSVKVVDNVSQGTQILPANERQARPLTLPPAAPQVLPVPVTGSAPSPKAGPQNDQFA